MLGFNIPAGQYTTQVLEIPHKPFDVVTDTTPEGRALLSFLLPIAKEPKYYYILL